MKYKKFATAAGIILMLSGCSFAPELAMPKMDLPVNYDNKTDKKQAVNIDWWKNFNDKTLNKLIGEALKNNSDLQIAAVRVEEAKAYLGLESANLYPAVSVSALGSRQRIAKDASPSGKPVITDTYTFSSSVSYEIDLWGKLRNQKKAALALLLSSRAARDTVKISLISNVANTYFNLVSIVKQFEIAQNTEKSYEETYKYRQKQHKYGQISELAVAQSKAQYENSRLLVESLKSLKITTMSALAVMLGRSPKDIFDNDIVTGAKLPKPIKIPSFLPSSVLENRPDIEAARENLKAKNALIGAAKAAYFPSISLTGLLGFQSLELSDLIQRSSNVWSITHSFGMNIFDFGRIKSNVELTKTQKQEAILQYKKAVINAFREVFDALSTLKSDTAKLDAQKKEVEALKKALELSKQLFDGGTIEYLDVLSAQRAYLAARLSLEGLKSKILTDQVTLYKSLGGGWKNKNS